MGLWGPPISRTDDVKLKLFYYALHCLTLFVFLYQIYDLGENKFEISNNGQVKGVKMLWGGFSSLHLNSRISKIQMACDSEFNCCNILAKLDHPDTTLRLTPRAFKRQELQPLLVYLQKRYGLSEP